MKGVVAGLIFFYLKLCAFDHVFPQPWCSWVLRWCHWWTPPSWFQPAPLEGEGGAVPPRTGLRNKISTLGSPSIKPRGDGWTKHWYMTQESPALANRGNLADNRFVWPGLCVVRYFPREELNLLIFLPNVYYYSRWWVGDTTLRLCFISLA